MKYYIFAILLRRGDYLKGRTTKGVNIRKAHGTARMPGLTNGLTNGLNVRTLRKSSGNEKKHGKILSVAVLCFLVLGVFAVLTYQSQQKNTITIDGNFDDWQGVAKQSKERTTNVPENIDISEYASTESGRNVAFYAKVYGNMLYGDGRYIVEVPNENPVYVAEIRENAIPNANGRDVAYVFIDIDNNANTGFKPSDKFAVGADRAIEVVGKNGKIEASRVLEFAGTVPYEWNWVVKQSVDSATNGKQLETMASKSVLGIGDRYAVYFYMVDWQGKECKVENALKFENAKVSLFGLYLAEQATVITESTGMEIKGTAHDPIHINGNSDFASQASANGWPGDGTEGNPYIIEGYDIDGNGGTYCIWIENTDVWFVVQNCKMWNATSTASVPYGTGIYLKDVTHGTLANNNCSGNSYYGIYLDTSSNYNTITNNNCSGNSWYGIYLDSSGNNNITNNNCSYNSNQGIYLVSSRYNNITNNNCSYNSNYGIDLASSSNNNITNNNCSGNSYGISVGGAAINNYIRNNNCSYNSYGIYLGYSSSNNDIRDNNCSYNSENGIYLWHSRYNNITNNNCSYNSNYGISLLDSSNNNITNNNFYHNTNYAIYIPSGSGNIIHHNNFWQNNGAGKGVNGNCQAYVYTGGNYWYDNTAQEGNYWSNWDGQNWGTSSAYPINGGAGASDWYPLSKPALPPLHIIGNDNLSYYAILYGWPGDGTSGNPYRIDGYYLNANVSRTASTFGIWVENTTAWFVVSNCTIKNATNDTVFPYGAGLCMLNVTNGKAENNPLTSDRIGISLSSSSNNTIMNNNCSENSYYGIYLYFSSNNNITNNNCSGNGAGIYLYSSTNNTITNNNFYNNTNYAIYITSGSTGNIIHHNNFYQNNGAGKGVSGNFQAYDDVGGNYWYDNTLTSHNFRHMSG